MNQMRGISGSGSSSREARRRKARSTSPVKDRSKTSSSKLTSSSSSSKRSTSPSATLLDVDDDVTSLFHDYPSPNPNPNPNPRSFPHSVKQKCWEKADKVKGRDPDRWRRDALGNTLFRKLVGCPGCLCHDYDHIIPYSKGGESTLENCQVLQVRFLILSSSLCFPFEAEPCQWLRESCNMFYCIVCLTTCLFLYKKIC
ncbi:hypothetical protein D0Y65_045413 [Glycine soja]|uniref:HNH domain-containing protein n=1 Tax=Glycine soja TaxID=3848 RepID=A0A445G4S5_GLYSO|nr:hypothetical protein D0Y65_045413 [Glycine soja]